MVSLEVLKKHRCQLALVTHPDRQQRGDDFSAKFNEIDFKQSHIELTLLEDWLQFELKKRSGFSFLLIIPRRREEKLLLERLEDVKRSLNAHIRDQHAALGEGIASLRATIQETRAMSQETRAACESLNRHLDRLDEEKERRAAEAPVALPPFKERVFVIHLNPAPPVPPVHKAKAASSFKKRVITIKTVNTTPESPDVLPRSASAPNFFPTNKHATKKRHPRIRKRSQSETPTWKKP